MRYKRSVERVVVRENVPTRVVCDLCGAERKERYEWPGEDNASDVHIYADLGDIWPEGDCRTRHEIDCCPRCFLQRVKPAIEALGVKFRERPSEWHEDGREEDPNG